MQSSRNKPVWATTKSSDSLLRASAIQCDPRRSTAIHGDPRRSTAIHGDPRLGGLARLHPWLGSASPVAQTVFINKFLSHSSESLVSHCDPTKWWIHSGSGAFCGPCALIFFPISKYDHIKMIYSSSRADYCRDLSSISFGLDFSILAHIWPNVSAREEPFVSYF